MWLLPRYAAGYVLQRCSGVHAYTHTTSPLRLWNQKRLMVSTSGWKSRFVWKQQPPALVSQGQKAWLIQERNASFPRKTELRSMGRAVTLPSPSPTARVSGVGARQQRNEFQPRSAKGRSKERPFRGPVFSGEVEHENEQPPCKSNRELRKIRLDKACFS